MSNSGDGKISTGGNGKSTWGRKFPKCFSNLSIALCTAFIEEDEYMGGAHSLGSKSHQLNFYHLTISLES